MIKQKELPKTTKIRSGLYEVCYVVDNHNLVEYRIEKNDGTYDLGKWIVSYSIGTEDNILGDAWLDTKKEALEVVAEMAGNFEYKPGLGWCYNA